MISKKNNSAKTVLIISVGFIIVFFITELKWALYVALTVGLLGIISNKLSDFIDFLWMKLAKVLSYIVPNILLTCIFYIFLFPIAILSRIFGGKNTLQLKGKEDSIWVTRDSNFEKSSFEKMW